MITLNKEVKDQKLDEYIHLSSGDTPIDIFTETCGVNINAYPTQALIYNMEHQFMITPGLESTDDWVMEGEFTSSFVTGPPPISVTLVYPKRLGTGANPKTNVQFNFSE